MHAGKGGVTTVVALRTPVHDPVPVGGKRVGIDVVGGQVSVILVPHVFDGAAPVAPIHAHGDSGSVGGVPARVGTADNHRTIVTDARGRVVGNSGPHHLAEGAGVAGSVRDVADADGT